MPWKDFPSHYTYPIPRVSSGKELSSGVLLSKARRRNDHVCGAENVNSSQIHVRVRICVRLRQFVAKFQATTSRQNICSGGRLSRIPRLGCNALQNPRRAYVHRRFMHFFPPLLHDSAYLHLFQVVAVRKKMLSSARRCVAVRLLGASLVHLLDFVAVRKKVLSSVRRCVADRLLSR